mgnify:CR=1 FL=1
MIKTEEINGVFFFVAHGGKYRTPVHLISRGAVSGNVPRPNDVVDRASLPVNLSKEDSTAFVRVLAASVVEDLVADVVIDGHSHIVTIYDLLGL